MSQLHGARLGALAECREKTVHVTVPAELRDFQAAPVTGARPGGVARMVTS